MNLILLFKDDFKKNSNKVRLTDRRFLHVKEILKAKETDELTVGLLDGKIGKGIITSINNDSVELEVILNQDPIEKLPLNLILALPRPIVLKRLIPAITSMGVKNIVLLNTNRVEKSYWNSPVLSASNMADLTYLGLEQAEDTIAPKVFFRQQFKPFVEDELPGFIKGTKAFVAHPYSKNKCPSNCKQEITLLVGPEGGLIDYEIKMLEDVGFKTFNMGKRILRVETAVIALISKLS